MFQFNPNYAKTSDGYFVHVTTVFHGIQFIVTHSSQMNVENENTVQSKLGIAIKCFSDARGEGSICAVYSPLLTVLRRFTLSCTNTIRHAVMTKTIDIELRPTITHSSIYKDHNVHNE